MKKPFRFKQFTIHQDRCAMKVGTDGVLLGAWASLEHHPNTVLDIGAGTGVIALQLAQRSHAEVIDAIELDEDAYEQCVENFEASDWGDRLFCYHASVQEFAEEMDETYDLIVSNPPFYVEDVSSGNSARDRARQANTMPFEVLLASAVKLLGDDGEFAVIVPFKEEAHITQLAKTFGLFPKLITRVKGNSAAQIKRSLLQFSFRSQEAITTALTIETERHQYTAEYQALTKDFYLKM
ncbi:methyltransferase [uncultured Croceitalea sp.]|uniref:tRNA1(Val) (adenine(37)-N6)-methyltransferase n=1 Tax=uncultured Croceitalea sp. TaxID=1798908 RepID=UPI003305D00B